MVERPLRKRLYEQLKKEILEGAIAQGQPLTEEELCRRFGVSRTPVREAIGMLIDEGLLTKIDHRGVFVSPISVQDVYELFQVREILELACVRLAYQQIPVDELNRFEGEFRAMREAATNGETSLELETNLDRSFHLALAHYSGNSLLERLMEMLHDQDQRIRMMATRLPKRFIETADEHLEIVQALKDRDLDHAIKAVQTHLENARKSALMITT